MIYVAVVCLQDGGSFVHQVLQHHISRCSFPSGFITLQLGSVHEHIGWLVLPSHSDVLVLWQIIVQEDLLNDDWDGPFHSFLNAPVEELGIILDRGQILLSKGKQLDGQVLNGD